MNEQRHDVSGQETVLTYSYLDEAADLALEQATGSEDGSLYNCLCSIVMSAFCLEAYVNHVGMDRFTDWDERAPPLDKLKRIAKDVEIEINYGKRPFQSIRLTNQFRNWMAHGRTEVLPFSYPERGSSSSTRGKVKRPRTRWEKMCSTKYAKRFLTDMEEVITMIHERSGYEGPALGVLNYTFYAKLRE